MAYNPGRNFSLLTLGQFVSIVGDRVSMAVFISIAAGIVASSQTTYQSSIVIVFQTMPFLLFGYLFGLMADLVEKKRILIFADFGRAMILVALYFYHESLIFLYFCVFSLGVLTSMFDPAKKSILPFLVRKDQLIFFNKLYSTIEIVAMMIGLAFGAFLLSKIGINNALLFDASTYIFSMMMLFFLSYHDEDEVLKVKKKESFSELFNRHIRELKEGWTYLMGNDNVKVVILNLVFFNFLAVAVLLSSVIDFSIRTFEFGKIFLINIGFDFENLLVGSHTTFVFLFVAIGGLTSPLWKFVFRKTKDSILSIWIFLSGVIVISLVVVGSSIFSMDVFYPFFLLAMFIMGAIVGMQYIRVIYLIQMNTDKKYMGRVVSLSDIIWSLSTFIGILLGAYLSEIFTYRVGFLVGGVIYLMGAISFWILRDRIDW
jgi:MFS family permease